MTNINMQKHKKTIYKVLRMYYVDGMLQSEIGKRLSMTRSKIARYIYYAREQKLVETKFNFTINENDELETLFENKFGLKECRIIPTYENNEDTYKYTSIELSEILERILEDGDYIGISWGTTIEGVSRHLSLSKKIDVHVVPAFCAIGIEGENNSVNFLTKNFATHIGGKSYPVHIPAVLDSIEAKEIMQSQKQTKDLIELNKKINTIVLATGIFNTSFTKIGAFSQDDVNYLKTLGVVGILNMEFLNANGERIINKIDDRVVRILPYESLKKINNSILVSWGLEKVEILKAVIKSKSVNIFITDEKTAKGILDSFYKL